MKKFLTILSLVASFHVQAQCNEDAPVTHLLGTGSGEIYRPNLSAVKGGDTIRFVNGNYDLIELNAAHGDPCRPIIITYDDSFYVATLRLKKDMRYFEVYGGDTASGEYNIKTNVFAVENCRNFWIHNVWGAYDSADNAFLIKTQPNYYDTTTWFPNYFMDSIKLTHSIGYWNGGEWAYIGHTQPDGIWAYNEGRTDSVWVVPVRVGNVEVAYNQIYSPGWDAIQISNSKGYNRAHHNYIYNYGRKNAGSQQAAIIMGGNANGDIDSNTITKGTGNGIQAFGYGQIRIRGNRLDSCGWDGRTYELGRTGQHSIYTNDYLIATEENPKQEIIVSGNAINYPPPRGAMNLNQDNDNSLPSTVSNNTVCLTGDTTNWQAQYLLLEVEGTTSANNIIQCPAPEEEESESECQCIISTEIFINKP